MPDHASRTVAVTGATGFVGRHLVRTLLDRGFRVRALSRTTEKAKNVLPNHERLTVVAGDVLDGHAPELLLKGATDAVHLIGIIREAGKGQTFQRMHVDATRAMVRACEAAGVKRYVQMSALGASDDSRTEYGRTKFQAESAVRASDLDWTIFRPGLIHGPDGEFTQMARDWAKGRAAPWFFLPYFSRVEKADNGLPRLVAPTIAPVYVDDVAGAFADALDTPESIGEIFMLVGPEELSFPDFLTTVRDALPVANKDAKPFGIPGELAAIKAHALSALGMGNLLPFDAGMAIMGSQDSIASNTKIERQLGFNPKPFTPTLKAYASQL